MVWLFVAIPSRAVCKVPYGVVPIVRFCCSVKVTFGFLSVVMVTEHDLLSALSQSDQLVKDEPLLSEAARVTAYKEQIKYANRVCGYAQTALPIIEKAYCKNPEEQATLDKLVAKIKNAHGLLLCVIDQTERRVIKKKSVPSGEKVTSFFETHTDIIVKKNRETNFGHKVVFASGSSNLILDCLMERGNPADTEQFMTMLERQQEIYGRMPRQLAADGGYASKDNLAKAKEAGIKDVSFSKKRGLAIEDMVKSTWVYKRLKNFRAGIEANISVLKRAFGLRRCNWSGWEGFQQYIWSSVVSYNLLVLARLKLKAA